MAAEVRLQQQGDDSCMACHMPRLASADIAHTAVTDHRILRQPELAKAKMQPRRTLAPGEVPMVNLYADQLKGAHPSQARDLGVALLQEASREPGPMRHHLDPIGLPLVEKAVQQFPDDVFAWEVLAGSAWPAAGSEFCVGCGYLHRAKRKQRVPRLGGFGS